MKQTSLILSILAFLGVIALSIVTLSGKGGRTTDDQPEAITAERGAVVFYNLDKVLELYDYANDIRSVVETKVQSINEEVNRRGSKLEKEIKSFQEKIDKGLITRSVAEVQSQKLQQQQNEFQNYAGQKQQEINEEQVVMMNQIADAIKKYIDEFNAEKGYAMIISSQGDILPAPVATGDAALDITDELIEGLNAAYVKEKAKENKENKK